MSKLSAQVQNQIKVSDKVVAAARTHATRVSQALAEQAATAQGAKAPTAAHFKAIITSLADSLDWASNNLEQTELGYTAEQADDIPMRRDRDAATKEGLESTMRLRSTVESTMGSAGVQTYGLQGETPRAPRRLASHMSNIISLMMAKPATVATEFGGTFDTATAVAVLKPKYEKLSALLKDEAREARELEEALTNRDRAMATWADVYQGVANALTGMFRLGGYKELAERVRPTQRTVRGEDPGPEVPKGEGNEGAGANQ